MSLESVFKLSLVMNIIDRMTGPMAGVASSVGGSISKMDKMNQTLGSMAKTGAVMQEMGNQIMGAALAPVEATFETRRALGELASLGVKDLEAVETAARNFSDQWAGTSKADFISAAYDIKSGIASLNDEGVAGFTSLAALTGKATKSTAAEMTSLFATGYGIYKDYYDDLSDMEFGAMFSAGISESVRAFKTSGSGMAQSIQTLGASATNANVPLEEQLSILGMLQATMGGAEAGTKYKAFLRSAVKGGEELGLKFTDANNQLLSMPEILSLLRGKFGETMDAAEKMQLQKAFGDTESVALIDLMYNKVGDLQTNILGIYDALGQGTGVAQKMASAMQETEPERFERLQQRIHNVKESIGNSLLPTINDLMSKGEGVLTKIGSWIEKNQELVRVIMIIVLAVGGFLAVAGTAIAVISGVGLVITKTISGIKLLKAGFMIAKGALTPLIGSVWSFTAALLANPITWIVIGIVALIAGIVLLYNKCEWFRNAVDAIFAWFKEGFGAILNVGKAAFEGIGNVIDSVMGAAKATVSEKLGNMKAAYEEHGGGIKGTAAAAMEGVKGIYTAGYTFIDNLTGGKLTDIKNKFFDGVTAIRDGIGSKISEVGAKFSQGIENIKTNVSNSISWFFTSGQRIVTTFADGIKGAFSTAVDAVKGGLQKIRNLLPFSDAKEGPLSTLTLSGQRTMTTYAHGLTLAQDAPAEAMQKGLSSAKVSLEQEPAKKVKIGGSTAEAGKTDEGSSSSSGEKKVIIEKLLMQVDLKKIKDLQMLLNLLKEVEDYTNANGGSVDPQPNPA
ncbi:MAG: phage tail tape measure protein [Acutalibacter sp.]|jgi:TP901 family phage tail tape measure protein